MTADTVTSPELHTGIVLGDALGEAAAVGVCAGVALGLGEAPDEGSGEDVAAVPDGLGEVGDGAADVFPSHGRQTTRATVAPTTSSTRRSTASRRRRYTAGECRRTGGVLTLSG